MTTLSGPLREAILFETNYNTYFESLMIINRPRFRTLGDIHCRNFVTHAARVGDDMRFDTLGSVSYLMFLMHWLGSFFHEDPRHASLTSALTGPDGEEDAFDEAGAEVGQPDVRSQGCGQTMHQGADGHELRYENRADDAEALLEAFELELAAGRDRDENRDDQDPVVGS
jgi:hypothetical protein